MQMSSKLRKGKEKDRRSVQQHQLYLNRKGPIFSKFPASDSRGSNEIQNCFPSYPANLAPTKVPNKFPF